MRISRELRIAAVVSAVIMWAAVTVISAIRFFGAGKSGPIQGESVAGEAAAGDDFFMEENDAYADLGAWAVGSVEESGGDTLPDGATAVADAVPSELVGEWEGEFLFKEFSGYEDMPGAPADISERLDRLLSEAVPFSVEMGDEGDWSFWIKAEMGTSMSSDDLMNFRGDDGEIMASESSPLITELSGGSFRIDQTMEEGGNSGEVLFSGTLCRDASGELLAGQVSVSMSSAGQSVSMCGEYTARPVPVEEE
ncbi:hypothetical protein [Lachnoclostridium sp. Marseille-P6806]|uniref:hypothetical protein n=1 Tax=Lachnoclostridium sp. Marseille-P6806 TaxID=2364793 RepID=UPI0010309922|nr:hypothetical protein [Lachnoclostridium sp. Marseille-P6806]